jgi:hypothetical protein
MQGPVFPNSANEQISYILVFLRLTDPNLVHFVIKAIFLMEVALTIEKCIVLELGLIPDQRTHVQIQVLTATGVIMIVLVVRIEEQPLVILVAIVDGDKWIF